MVENQFNSNYVHWSQHRVHYLVDSLLEEAPGHSKDTAITLSLIALDDLHTVDLKPAFLKSAPTRLGTENYDTSILRNRRNRMNNNFYRRT